MQRPARWSWRRLLPLESLPRKVRLRLWRDVFGFESITSPVLDFRMEMPLRFAGLTTALTLYRERELDQLNILKSVLRPGDHVLEIGANIGYYAMIAARAVGATGHVTAFEPDPRNVDFLERNIRLNGLTGRITLHAQAVSDQPGSFEFQMAQASNLSSVRQTAASTAVNYAGRGYVGTVNVTVAALGAVLAQSARPVDVMRMDVEGHEVEILDALASHLEREGPARAPRAVVFEPHSWEYANGKGIAGSLAVMERHGYRITHLGTRNEQSSPVRPLGWRATRQYRERRGVVRGVYENPPQAEAARLAATTDGITTICLQRQDIPG